MVFFEFFWLLPVVSVRFSEMYFLSTRNLDTLWPVYSPFFLVPLFILPLLIPPFIFDDTVSGYCDPRFEPVYQAFRQNFGEGLEREGAAVAIYHKGKRVVNMWGGYADREANRKWRHDTKTVLFSATKAMAALSVAVLVDRGYLSYDDRVVDYWPEYGQHGKENTTIEHILSHMAGIPFLDEHIDLEHLSDFAVLEKNMENSKPLWEPGSASGYHALTFGFLIDALVRRVDEKGRDLQTFFREEIAEPHDIQASIGLPKEEAPFLARITMPTVLEFIRDIVKNPKLIPMLILMYVRPDDIVHRIRENPSWLLISFDTMVVNDPEVIQLPIGAVTGVSDADSLARMFSLTMNEQLIGNHTLELLKIPTLNSWHLEKVVLWPVAKGRGFFYERHPVIPGAFLFGHPGYGGQFIAVDPANELVIAYVANGLKTGTGELCGTYMRLFNAMYESLRG